MNKQELQDRLALLKEEREKTRLTVFAYDGAIQECEYWLNQLESKEPQVDHRGD